MQFVPGYPRARGIPVETALVFCTDTYSRNYHFGISEHESESDRLMAVNYGLLGVSRNTTNQDGGPIKPQDSYNRVKQAYNAKMHFAEEIVRHSSCLGHIFAPERYEQAEQCQKHLEIAFRQISAAVCGR
jgi:hypothetical protein